MTSRSSWNSLVAASMIVGLAALLLASGVASAAAKTRSGVALSKYAVRDDAPDANYVWANLTWAGTGGEILWGGEPSPEAEGQATPSETVNDLLLDAESQQYSLTQERIAAQPAPEVFTSKPSPKHLNLNVSRPIQVDLYVKKTEANPTPCRPDPYADSDPYLDVELYIGTQRIAAALANQYVQGSSKGVIDDGSGLGAPAGDWFPCRHRLAPEIEAIPEGAILTLRVVHVKQATVYTFGFSDDHRSAVRFPLYSPEELYYRHPELFATPDDEDGPTTLGSSFAPALFALGLLAPAASRRRWALLLVLAVALPALAGCLGSKAGTAAGGPAASGGGRVETTLIKDEENVLTELGRGTILGVVFDDLRLPLAGVHISLLGRTEFTASDDRGRFRLSNLPAGTHTLRFDASSYRSIEASFEVKAGFVTKPSVQLDLVNPKSRDERPHPHNEWLAYPEGKKLLMNTELPLACNAQGQCQTPPTFQIVPKEDQSTSVMPGTGLVVVTLGWTEAELGPRLGLAYQAANDPAPLWMERNWSVLAPRGPNVPFRIPTTWEMTDSGHAMMSGWRLEWFVPVQDAPNAVEGQRDEASPNPGRVTAKIEIFRGGALPMEAPHPDHWKGGTTITVLQQSANAPICAAAAHYQCDLVLEYPASKVVPQGTVWLEAELTQDRDGFPTHYDWDLFFLKGNERYRDPKSEHDAYREANRLPSADWRKTQWRIPVKDAEADPVYATTSGWNFLFEIEDRTEGYTDGALNLLDKNPMAMKNGLKMKVVAHRDAVPA